MIAEHRAYSFFIPSLPWRNLSSNAGTRSRRNPWDVAESRGRLKGEAMEAIKDLGTLAPFAAPVTAQVTLCHTGKRPTAEQCPRCRTLGVDYPNWALPSDRSKPIPCCEYRPKDVGNIGGDVLKPILDALTWMELLEDDDFTRLTAVTLRIARVGDLDQEGVWVTVTEAEEQEAA